MVKTNGTPLSLSDMRQAYEDLPDTEEVFIISAINSGRIHFPVDFTVFDSTTPVGVIRAQERTDNKAEQFVTATLSHRRRLPQCDVVISTDLFRFTPVEGERRTDPRINVESSPPFRMLQAMKDIQALHPQATFAACWDEINSLIIQPANHQQIEGLHHEDTETPFEL